MPEKRQGMLILKCTLLQLVVNGVRTARWRPADVAWSLIGPTDVGWSLLGPADVGWSLLGPTDVAWPLLGL